MTVKMLLTGLQDCQTNEFSSSTQTIDMYASSMNRPIATTWLFAMRLPQLSTSSRENVGIPPGTSDIVESNCIQGRRRDVTSIGAR